MKKHKHTPPGLLARFHPALLATLLASGATAGLQAAATIYGKTDDRQVNSAGSLSDGTSMQCGYSASTCMNPVFVFQFPTLPAGKEFSNVSLRFYHMGKDGTPTYNADLYGLGVSSSPSVVSGDFYAGPLDASSVLIKDNMLVPSSAATSYTTSAQELTDYLNAAYANGAGSGQYVFIRLSPDVAGLNAYTRYKVYSADYTGGSYYWPSLTYDTVDADLGWRTVPVGGGGFVTGLISDATGADIYCRSDVGGAFKWNAATSGWQSITDTIVPTHTTGATVLMNTGAIALDPSDSSKLYVAAGKTTGDIYASPDKGATWTKITTTALPVYGNGGYRSYGERLAVDPNDSNVVWYGSAGSGLYKGVNSGGAWTWTLIPTTSVPVGDSTAGVTFVACDKNGSSTIVYAGVFAASGSTGGVYKSTDGGSTWTMVGGSTITKPARGQVSANGTLYITGAGIVARMLRGGALADITPVVSINYRGLAIAASDTTGNTLYVSEAASGTCRMWRSTNGGVSWSLQTTVDFNDDQAISRQEPDGTPTLNGYWFGNVSSLLVNPTNGNELWAGDFFGVARTTNAQLMGGTTAGTQPIWHMLQKNQDETCVEVVKTVPSGSARLYTGFADVGGYAHYDTMQRPAGSYGRAFYNPGSANTTSIDFMETNPNVMVRAYYGNSDVGTGAYSTDAGYNWLHFGEIARKAIASGAAGWEEWDLSEYLASQKAKGATLVTLVLGSTAATNYSSAPVTFESRENTDSAVHPVMLYNGTTSVEPVADTYIAGSTTTTNYGANTGFNVAHTYTGNTTNERQAYLKFDLGAVSSITSARLRLYRRAATAGIYYNVGVFACANTSWIEGDGGGDNLPAGELTWSNRPKPNASASGLLFGGMDYVSSAGVMLRGGRVAVSSADAKTIVWMPFGTSVVPHYSVDCGVTWSPCVGLPSGVNRLAGKSNPSYLMIQLASDRANGQFYMTHLSTGGGNHTVYRSTDGGANWSSVGTIAAGTYNIYRTQIVAAPAANDVWFSDDGVSGTTSGGVWRSTDGGVTWTRVGSSTVRAVRQVSFGATASGAGYTVFINGYVGGLQGVYRSDDYGSTWTRMADVPTVCSIESLAGDRQEFGRVYIGTAGRGVFTGK